MFSNLVCLLVEEGGLVCSLELFDGIEVLEDSGRGDRVRRQSGNHTLVYLLFSAR